MLYSKLKCILKFTMFMQNIENNSYLSPSVQLLWSMLLEWEERICLLIGLFQISHESPTTTLQKYTTQTKPVEVHFQDGAYGNNNL